MRDLDKYQKQYVAEKFEPWQVKMRQRKLLEIMGQFPHKNILEIGCALDPLFKVFQDFDQLTILEPGDVFYHKAVSALSEKDTEGVSIQNQSLEDAYSGSGKQPFDFILLSSLLHEVKNPKEILEIIYGISNENTVTTINVPNANSFHRLLALEMGIIDSVYAASENQSKYQQNKIFDMQSLIKMVTDVGFHVLESGSYFIKPFTHNQMSELMESGILNESVLDGLYGMTAHLPEMGSEIYVNIKKQ